MKKKNFIWRDKISNHHALGGIELSTLDNGQGRGTRIAWINTGSGLRYKVIIDRSLDIADAFYGRHSLAWLSHAGVTRTRSVANNGLGWLYNFSGGLLVTCGLTHTGEPEEDEFGQRGLHGRISSQPAQVISIRQPDLVNGELNMSITGLIKQTTVFGPQLELRRTIAGTLGESVIRISDIVTNTGNTEVPHMILYHCNFGWPLVDEGSDIVWDGTWKSFGSKLDNEIFNNNRNFKRCPPPMNSHRGFGEACCAIDLTPDNDGICTVGINNCRLPLAVRLTYKKKQLPWLTNWQHWGYGDYVTALEPGTNPPIGQKRARKENKLIFLQPGESRNYELEFKILIQL